MLFVIGQIYNPKLIFNIRTFQQNRQEQALASANHAWAEHSAAVRRFSGSRRRQLLMKDAAAAASSLCNNSERLFSMETTSPLVVSLYSFLSLLLSHGSGTSSCRTVRIFAIRSDMLPLELKGVRPVRSSNAWKCWFMREGPNKLPQSSYRIPEHPDIGLR